MTKIDSFKGEYAFLSNLYPSQFWCKSVLWPTVEHAYQAFKSKDPAVWIKFQRLPNPAQAKKEGRRILIRDDWEQIKEKVMLHCLRKKFEIPSLRQKLLVTGDAILIEGNWWGDRYWGVCEGQGENRLGQLLMRVRRELR